MCLVPSRPGHWLSCGSQALEPNLWATATLMASSDSLSPTACSQSPQCGKATTRSLVILRQMELWKGLGSFYLLQLAHPKPSGCVVFADRVSVSWPGLSIMSP